MLAIAQRLARHRFCHFAYFVAIIFFCGAMRDAMRADTQAAARRRIVDYFTNRLYDDFSRRAHQPSRFYKVPHQSRA